MAGWTSTRRSRARKGTQAILDGIYPSQPVYVPPDWYVSPEVQLERVWQLNKERGWGFLYRDFPAVPNVQLSGTEVLLLAVYLPAKEGMVSAVQRTFDEHVGVIRRQLAVRGLSFLQSGRLKSDPDHLQLFGTDCYESAPGLRWVVYDYAANHGPKNGHTVIHLWNVGRSGLAASEVLSALMLFPEYGPSIRTPDIAH